MYMLVFWKREIQKSFFFFNIQFQYIESKISELQIKNLGHKNAKDLDYNTYRYHEQAI